MAGHKTQHRTESDESRRSKAYAELKRENHKLQREVSRLQKEVERLSANAPTDWQKAAKNHLEAKVKGVLCFKCSSPDVKTLQLPIGTLKVCQSCGHKEKVDGRVRKTG